jgi:hypothetical protein
MAGAAVGREEIVPAAGSGSTATCVLGAVGAASSRVRTHPAVKPRATAPQQAIANNVIPRIDLTALFSAHVGTISGKCLVSIKSVGVPDIASSGTLGAMALKFFNPTAGQTQQ